MQKETLQDKIAIILPVFNSSKYLEPCLQPFSIKPLQTL